MILCLNTYKKSVNKMTCKEKVCFLMFDEVSLQPHVEYQKHEDAIVGVENGNIVDHALVFMVKAIFIKLEAGCCVYIL